jgi:hypothetical protein
VNAFSTKKTNTSATTSSTFRALRLLYAFDDAASSFDWLKESLMDKYELLLALSDLRRRPKEEERYLQTFAQAQSANLKWMLKGAAE